MTDKISENIKNYLKDFTQDSDKVFAEGVTYKHRLSGDYDMWRMARFIFSQILSFKVSDQPVEKVNWWVSFIFKSKYKCAIAHQKFGFRVYVTAETEKEAEEVAKDLEKIIYKSIQLSKPLFEGYAQTALSKGDIIVENHFIDFKRPYDFFRKEYLDRDGQREFSKQGFEEWLERNHFKQATCFSFYSMLEHLCVLFLAFRDVPDRKDLMSFSKKTWSEKFKIVFDINNKDFKEVYDQLLSIARYQRNPNAHGGSDTIFSFFLEGANHKMSASLHEQEIFLQWSDGENNFGVMESFLNLIKTAPDTKNIFKYIEHGFNIDFKATTTNDMVANLNDDEIDEYIHHQMRLEDDMANMDW